MSKQAIKQQARQAAREAALRRRREQQTRERTRRSLVEQVLVAVAERDAAIAEHDRQAGVALRELVESEGLTLREVVEWCDDQISVREATRLRALAAQLGNVSPGGAPVV